MLKRKALISLILSLIPILAAAQPTRIKGSVKDADTGEPVPFAGIYFDGTTIGTTSDLEGNFFLETRSPDVHILTASILGYESASYVIVPGAYSEVNFILAPTLNRLNAAVVKPDNSYMKSILRKISDARDRNDPEKRPEFTCDVYSKTEIDLANPHEQMKNKVLRKHFGFVMDYIDTSAVSGKPFIPAMIAETKSKRIHQNSPLINKELISASRISGLSPDNVLLQYTGATHFRPNFYDNYINVFGVDVPSPATVFGETFYNYYLVDSLSLEGRKTYVIRYHPKKIVSTPVFDGEMNVDAADFGLRSVKARLAKGANVNWVRDYVTETVNRRVGDSAWFYLKDNIYADFAITKKDTRLFVALLGKRENHYSNPVFSVAGEAPQTRNDDAVKVAANAGEYDDSWWDKERPYALTKREQGIYEMVERVQSQPFYRTAYDIINMIAVGYYETKYVGIGQYSTLFAFNNLEGFRLRLGARTTKNVSKKVRLTGYAAYGFKDHKFKGGGTVECVFSQDPWRKLTLTAKHDVIQLGRGTSAILTESNIFNSIFARTTDKKLCPVTEFSVKYDRELAAWFNTSLSLESIRIASNRYVPMVTPRGEAYKSILTNQMHWQGRLSFRESVTRGVFHKGYMYTKYPVVTVDLSGALQGFLDTDFGFLRSELTIDYRVSTVPLGTARFRFNIGKIFGQVPYPLLKLHEGNDSFFFDKGAYACMQPYEFASDFWTTLFYEQNFGGYFLGKIPGIKKLNLREVFTLKMAWGTISKENDGSLGQPGRIKAPFVFPEGLGSLRKPYVEMGVGISNILTCIRVDAFWRVTHRYTTNAEGVRVKSPNRFSINVGFEFHF